MFKKSSTTFFFFVLCTIIILFVICEKQQITVKGTTICNKERVSVEVSLWERDLLESDDKLAEMNSTKLGEFHLSGFEDELGAITPYLKIVHNCNVVKNNCHRVVEFFIPESKIGRIYDMTYVPLDILWKEDKEICD